MKKKTGILIVVIALVAVLVLGTIATHNGKSGANGSYYSYEPAESGPYNGSVSYKSTAMGDSAYAMPELAYDEAYDVPAESTSVSESVRNESKIIRTVNITLKSEHFDEAYAAIEEKVKTAGGYIEYASLSGSSTHTATMTLRIPSGQLDAFLDETGELGTVTSMTQKSEDVSESYYDTADRLKTQREKLNRLQTLLAKAQKVSEIIEIENAISDTQYYIDYYTGKLNGYDSKVAYSYVYLTLKEYKVSVPVEKTFWQKIGERLMDSLEEGLEFLEEFVLFTVSALPFLLVILIIVIVCKKLWKRRKARKTAEKNEETRNNNEAEKAQAESEPKADDQSGKAEEQKQ